MSKIRSLFITLGLFVLMSKMSYAQICAGTAIGNCGGYGSDCPIGKRCILISASLGMCQVDEDNPCPGTENEGNECSPAGCSESNGCGWGYSCDLVHISGTAQGLRCVVNNNCRPDPNQQCTPDANGCSATCGANRICTYAQTPDANRCQDSPGSCMQFDPNGENECNTAGQCGGVCGVGRKCVVSGNRGPRGADRLICITVSANECPSQHSCSELGACNTSAESQCGPGYSCINYQCVVDPTCLRDTIQVPYTGPKIRNFSTVMAAVYNLLFPGAILFGAIMIIVAGHKLMTSEGDPRKTKEGQEDLSSAVLGTAFVVLSAALLRIIISQILGGTVSF